MSRLVQFDENSGRRIGRSVKYTEGAKPGLGTHRRTPADLPGRPIWLAQTVGRHNVNTTQAVNLYYRDTNGNAQQQLDASNNPLTVQAVNMICNLAGGIWIYIVDLTGCGVVWDILSGDPCSQGNTNGPTPT